MHDESRLLLCRAGFGLFCVAPTLLVALWCMQRASGDFANAQRDEWQLGLSHRLGLAFEIESVSYPSLGSARLAEVRALDPETKALLFQVPLVEVIPTAAGWKIVASRPQIEAERLPELVATLNDRLLRGSAAADQQCELIARDATLLAGPASRSFAEVAARLEALPTGPMLTISAGPMQLIATRNRQQTPPATRWQFDTAGQSLPMALLQAAWPKLAWLGAKAQFAGRLDVVAAENGLAGEMGGELAGVDLDSLVSEQFPHRLGGLAKIRLERLSLAGGKLVELRGTLQAQNGSISPSLLVAAGEHLELVPSDGLAALDPDRPVTYRHLSLGFHLGGETLQLAGSADATRPGVLLAGAGGPLLSAPPRHATAAVNLPRALLPASDYQVPATRQTDALIGLLPVPESPAARTATGHVPTRLAPAGSGPALRQPGLR